MTEDRFRNTTLPERMVRLDGPLGCVSACARAHLKWSSSTLNGDIIADLILDSKSLAEFLERAEPEAGAEYEEICAFEVFWRAVFDLPDADLIGTVLS